MVVLVLEHWYVHHAKNTTNKVVVPIPDLYLVRRLSMHSVHFKCIGECVSRQVIDHASHDKVLGLGTTTLDPSTHAPQRT
jgi:hypothetical protein